MKIKTVNISFPRELLDKLDDQASKEYSSRSELLKKAAIAYLQTQDNWRLLQSDLAKRARRQNISDEDDVEKLVDSLRN